MIVVDWGTSSLRGYRLDADGGILEQRRSDQGIAACQGRFPATLAALIDGWDGDVVLCGMIGSRNGWIELPYAPCPADAAALAASMQPLQDPALPGRTLWFVPGVASGADAVPDVMRGEETQLIGLLALLATESPAAEAHHVCLPGTHSKWVTLRDRRIASVATMMTGELYALLRTHSLLARLMDADDGAFDAAAFDAGVQRSGEPGGLLHHLFGVRSLGLFDRLSAAAAPSYLSGLLIGHELRAQATLPPVVHLVGGSGLLARYAHALAALGSAVRTHPEGLAARGLYRLAQQHGGLAG
ncbi:2-dehydro-3-deoxygalactonokinase [Xanthomonas sp. LMG 8992]|uniref:2-dehydro-3-deoxygalactonokinase n=1 Tax=Xanthomonas sp. LMG 8992 TaxID=1591157 RepID=UPI00136B73C8|nr:2-dehydro-3-deoxygalactonokinase [Xanthomonas sp. LMG 8992]MXV10617.1 2-dehydro-3-deoxygalactonokinase [Xanthomonas sp. LMG 8992]